jgi:hypothetical protein
VLLLLLLLLLLWWWTRIVSCNNEIINRLGFKRMTGDVESVVKNNSYSDRRLSTGAYSR